MFARCLAALTLVALLSACAKPVVETTGPLAIRDVSVSAADTIRAETDILSLVRQTVPAQILGVSDGKATKVEVRLVLLAYKNPVMSLLVGDSNKLGANVILRDMADQELARFDVIAIDQYMLNGVAGAVISVAQDKARVDRALARGLAETIEQRIYGRKTKPAMVPDLAAPMPKGPPQESTHSPAAHPSQKPASVGAGV
ncbi:hypothetical protein NS365_15290 [Aureimonas ureilytica]|uniref:Lipoprotein n=1 Tax=Aureimonas ureilytica TaxID=401562 RepID=A0A175RM65_9HYPH|nr:hypothetical protein [Aureimonas ureilytica]KTR04453.1 hypothetical protein NS365_15290 [Aureimonas ureilytica]